MDECAVVGHQQQAGGVVVEAPHRLHVATYELLRQQAEYTGVVAGLARALVVGRFVQRDVKVFAIAVYFTKDAEFKRISFDAGEAIGDGHAGNADVPVGDQFTAPLAGAEALGLQNTV